VGPRVGLDAGEEGGGGDPFSILELVGLKELVFVLPCVCIHG
jgi:hypothetical protein